MSWTWTARGCGQSLRKILGWRRSGQKWFLNFWKRSRKSSVCRCVMTFWNNSKLNRTCWRRRVMHLWVRSSDQAPESSVEESDIAEAEESEDGQVQNQGDVDGFLWCEGHCAHRILATGPDHQPANLQGHPATFDAVSAREEATNARKKSWLLPPAYGGGRPLCYGHLLRP